MNILAIDTSTMISTVTIADENEIIGDFNVNQQKTHSESMVPMIETLLGLLGMEIADIDKFVIAKGPGSFTGLRIGMTIAKTLAQVYKKDLIPISTLLALANNSSSDRVKVPMIDARGNRVYGAAYDKDFNELIKEDLYTIDDFSRRVNELGRSIELIGTMNEKYEDRFGRAISLPINFNNSIGRSLIKIALEGELIGEDLYTIKPNYLRKSQAERQLIENDKKDANK
ncbi:tRNA (adenosine(37)-N6)-threonylcarbamoyltransferase complex dimerization subunit type 1 TsaB [Anaerococcus sp. AGMB09787]|uniref:tRNA (adenosine(37)-N6)-threonylcarbamoyltransferase complex dimerization subunit type 1 TsaB n=1 Tax=Anaerococcus sp. AGMB09787 TaxID=2922869 RepID=UPI001FAF4D16|nr:tRNA (adenosine(37)-N6)-threonylcarbamoyltransferase complex dimerization subunit type 1 TsaB [Anaerococcus sp. AGMB09787]